jgi:hypothetical protein
MCSRHIDWATAACHQVHEMCVSAAGTSKILGLETLSAKGDGQALV